MKRGVVLRVQDSVQVGRAETSPNPNSYTMRVNQIWQKVSLGQTPGGLECALISGEGRVFFKDGPKRTLVKIFYDAA